jgi:hypothetical protein
MPISLPDMNSALKNWLNSSVRIDRWTLNMPSTVAVKQSDVYYLANSAVQFPPSTVEFEKNGFGLCCRAEFNFRIVYRAPGKLAFDDLPISAACGLLNNLYYDAVVNPAIISDSIITLTTPKDGVDIQISDPEEEGKDWLIFLNPQFYVEFKAAKATITFDPPKPVDPVIDIKQLDIAIYRGDLNFDVTNTDTFNLDRIYHLKDL